MTASTYRRWTIASLSLAVSLVTTAPVEARGGHPSGMRSTAHAGRVHARIILSGMVYRSRSSGLQCVPFARENSGIELSGNAANWWDAASGVYERGARPEVGSILNFRANGRMRMGHVAVVSNVLDSRNVEIDHANWSGRGSIRRNVRVADVSALNDWSAVRVAIGNGDLGSAYPTYGFIYDRPDHGTMIANSGVPTAPQAIRLNTLPMMAAAHDFGTPDQRIQLASAEEQEVAEASDDTTPRYRHTTGVARVRNGGARISHRTQVMTVAHRTHGTQATTAKHHHRL